MGVRHVGLLVCGSVEGGGVVGRRLTTLPTKESLTNRRRRLCTSAVEGREGWVVLGGDPVVTLEGAVPLAKLYSTTDSPSLLTLLPLSLSFFPLPLQ